VTCRTRYLSVRQACRTWNQAAVQDKKPRDGIRVVTYPPTPPLQLCSCFNVLHVTHTNSILPKLVKLIFLI
jgi:hypothetical protein